jgi:hypothetical protein
MSNTINIVAAILAILVYVFGMILFISDSTRIRRQD